MTTSTPATKISSMVQHCPRGRRRIRESRVYIEHLPNRHMARRRLPDVLRKMMNNIQNKEAR